MSAKLTVPDLTLDEIVGLLGMKPHPEGGHYLETFRDNEPEGRRGHSTAIYYLLGKDEVSAWHRVDSVEIWHWYAGSSLSISICEKDNQITNHFLGPDLMAGQRPQVIVPRMAWQSAKSQGTWTLVGCTVSPAFEFEGFELAPPDWSPGRKYTVK